MEGQVLTINFLQAAGLIRFASPISKAGGPTPGLPCRRCHRLSGVFSTFSARAHSGLQVAWPTRRAFGLPNRWLPKTSRRRPTSTEVSVDARTVRVPNRAIHLRRESPEPSLIE